MWKRSLLAAVLICLFGWQAAWAHAVLDHSQPEANAVLAASPAEIRLWMTEPVEPQYSKIELRDAAGTIVAVPSTAFAAADPTQMYVTPVQLVPGLYTVVWTTVSAADGHRSQGSFPFVVEAASQGAPAGNLASIAMMTPVTTPLITPAAMPGRAVETPVQELPLADVAVRWFNFLALIWAVGSIAFVVLVWRPAGLNVLSDQEPGIFAACERRLRRVIWIGWGLAGVASLLLLLLQAAVATGRSLFAQSTLAALGDVLVYTRFGTLWLARLAVWIALGVLIALSLRRRRPLWVALAAGAVLISFTSLFSHAQAATAVATAADWLHLLMTAVWLGGLIQLAAVLPMLGSEPPAVQAVDRLIAQFSNVARTAVAVIILTGFYAAWLQIGSLDALLTTLYGQLLLVKLVLVVPLAGIAAFNLIVTRRGLRAGGIVWTQRLHWLVGVELVLAMLVLLAVAGMTAIAPAHSVVSQRHAAAQAAAQAQLTPQVALQATPQAPQQAVSPVASQVGPPAQRIMDMQTVDELHVMLIITPGSVGENEFLVDLSTPTGEPVTDASLIRLRFDHQDLGQSELRIEPAANPDQQQGGLYRVTGANLSVPGEWRLRVTIARPDQYDTVVDFNPMLATSP
jgi:copper transport protein